MYYGEEIIEDVRSRNDIVDIIGARVKLKRSGSGFMGLCPFHGEKTPSFHVNPSRQTFHCFGCGIGGNVYTFLMEYENLTFQEAVKVLAERAGVALPEEREDPEARARADLRTKLLAVNKDAATFYYYQLRQKDGEQALGYLTGRQLSEETIRNFGLGYSPKSSGALYHYLKGKGYGDDLLKESGLFNYENKRGPEPLDKFWNRVMFPIMDTNNRVIGFGGRVMGDGQPKYLNSPETKLFDKSRNLYGLNVAKRTRRGYFIICEGYMDVISLHQAGFTNAVASLGTALTAGQANLISRYTKNVYLTYDSDGAGVKATLRAIPIMKEAGISTRIIRMNPYKDPDEFIKALGSEAFEERIRNAENSFTFEVGVMEGDYDLKDPEGKTKFLQAVARKLLDFPEEIERENYLEAIAAKYFVSAEALRKLVNRLGAGVQAEKVAKETQAEVRQTKKKSGDDGIRQSQRLMLSFIASKPTIVGATGNVLGPDDFTDPFYHIVAEEIYAQYEKEKTVTPARIIGHFETREEQSDAAGLFEEQLHAPVDDKELEKAVNETIRKIKKNSLDQQFQEAKERGDAAKLTELIRERNALQQMRPITLPR